MCNPLKLKTWRGGTAYGPRNVHIMDVSFNPLRFLLYYLPEEQREYGLCMASTVCNRIVE